MLVLSRKAGQRISIGDSIEITVVEVCDNQVRLGIEAPRSVPVFRRELLDQVRAENVQAATTAAPRVVGVGGPPVEAKVKPTEIAAISESSSMTGQTKGG